MGIKLSACTITKNEALNIGKSIESYKEYVDEVIIVDTGSIDETVEIAESKGAKVFKFEWRNDFSAAKNFALDNATGDWIVFLDADEWFDGDTAKNIREAIENASRKGYNSVACKMINFFTETEIMETASTIRVFKHSDNIRFCRSIHETLFDVNTNVALPGIYTELFTINHSGYMKGLLARKAKRNKTLLDKNFALGNAGYIDYFYGLRENLQQNPEVSEYFFKLIESVPNYDELVDSFNVSTSIDENKIKLVNSLSNKYSFDYRVELLERVQKKNDRNPNFKFLEYVLFEKIDRKRAIKALEDAIEFDKEFEKNNAASNNPFYGKRSETYAILGEHYMFINDKIKALDYFSQSIKAEYSNLTAFMGILHIISKEKTEDKVVFINSIFDISNKEVEKFIIDALRLTEHKEVFLYYFVDYYKKYEEVELAFFTSRLFTGNFEEVADKYVEVYKESRDDRALTLITAALIAGNCKEKFLELSSNLTVSYARILTSYFNEEKIENISESEFQILNNVFKEIAYVADDDIIKKIINMAALGKERICFEIVQHYYSKYSYDYVLKWINEFEADKELSDRFFAYINYLMTNICFTNNEFDKLPDYLDKVVSAGFLHQDIISICEMVEADDEKLQEYFELFDCLNFVKKNMVLDEVEDISSDIIKFMTIDKLEDEIKNKLISLVDEHIKLFFEFAVKAKAKKAFATAEKYYKISIKYGYKLAESYLALGEIYNCFEKPELSFYCYENAFIENFTLAKEILPKDHINSDYVFSKKKEKQIESCPLCGNESKLIATHINIFDENLLYNEPLIVKYRRCNSCSHIFAGNDIITKDHWEKKRVRKVDNDRIALAYDVLENICEITDGNMIFDSTNDNGEFKAAAENYGFNVFNDVSGNLFDIIFAGNSLNGIYNVEEALNQYMKNLSEDGIIIFELYDEGNAFSRLSNKPLWVKAGVKNVFSKKSIEVLFNKFDLHILQINVDKVNKGKIIVFAGK